MNDKVVFLIRRENTKLIILPEILELAGDEEVQVRSAALMCLMQIKKLLNAGQFYFVVLNSLKFVVLVFCFLLYLNVIHMLFILLGTHGVKNNAG